MLRGTNVRLRSDPRCHDEATDDGKPIEKIVARRRVSCPDGSSSFEYLVKYKGVSYLHVEWLSPNAILRKDDRYKSTLKKFVKLWLSQGNADDTSSEYFEPSFTVVEKVLGSKTVQRFRRRKLGGTPPPSSSLRAGELADLVPQDKEVVEETMYFVKWMGLPYTDCTWEWASDLDNDAEAVIAEFRANAAPPEGYQAALALDSDEVTLEIGRDVGQPHEPISASPFITALVHVCRDRNLPQKSAHLSITSLVSVYRNERCAFAGNLRTLQAAVRVRSARGWRAGPACPRTLCSD